MSNFRITFFLQLTCIIQVIWPSYLTHVQAVQQLDDPIENSSHVTNGLEPMGDFQSYSRVKAVKFHIADICLINSASDQGSPNYTNGIPISFKFLPMVPLVILLVPMVILMVALALPMVQLESQWYHWLRLPMSVSVFKVPFSLNKATLHTSCFRDLTNDLTFFAF